MKIVFLILYIITLVVVVLFAKKKNTSKREFFFANSRIGSIVGFLSFSATLFSTFTLMGIPEFFRTHGVGTWIFLGITDVVMAYVLLVYGAYIRNSYKGEFQGMAVFIRKQYRSPLAAWTYLIGAFLFLIPYASIQVRGIAGFLASFDGNFIPFEAWVSILILAMYLYSYFGGIRAIMYSDVIQGGLMLIVIVLVALVCLQSSNGWHTMLTQIGFQQPKLLSLPGPHGIFSKEYLFITFLSIILMPISNPQLNTRIMLMRSNTNFKKMAIAVAIFAFVVLIATIPIGFYGALHYPQESAGTFLYKTLIVDTPPLLSGLVVIGLIAAAMSTVDSQLFALGTEVSFYRKTSSISHIELTIFSFITLLFSLLSNQGIVSLARISFTGTAFLAPIILFHHIRSRTILYGSITTMLLFLLSEIQVLPPTMLSIRMDLLLLICLFLIAIIIWLQGIYRKVHSNLG